MRAHIGSNSGLPLRRDQISTADERRFWRLVQRTRGCWYWRFSDRGEYGQFRLRDAKITTAAHRIAAVLGHGDMPAGSVAMHACDEPSCVRPDHLTIGSQQDNVDDCKTKGRFRTGRAAKYVVGHKALAS